MEINNTQKKLIHIGIHELGISDETYRDMLMGQYGVNTCLNLNYHQASRFIDDLKKKGFRIKRKRGNGETGKRRRRPTADNLIYLPSRQQLAIIAHLRQDVRWKYHDGFPRWLEKFVGRNHVKTSKEAQKVIEALKAMKARQQKPDRSGR